MGADPALSPAGSTRGSEGGGAHWRSSNCDVDQYPTYVPALDAKRDPLPIGVFDFANRDDPFADYSVRFVPYCTGDAHLGNKTVTYSALPTLLEQNLADIRAVAPGFRSCTSPGKVHCILRRPEFYSTHVNGVRSH